MTSPNPWGITGEGFPGVIAQLFEAGDTIINQNGLFIYSAAPAAGDLVFSLAATAGTDPFGNAYLGGAAAYAGTSAITVNAGVINWWTGPAGGAGPWTDQIDFGVAIPGAISLFGASGTALEQFAIGNTLGSFIFVFPSGDATGATDYANISNGLESNKQVILIPGQYYINQTLNLITYGPASLFGAGSGVTNIEMVTNNIPILQTAGFGQRVIGITFKYATQQTVTDTNGVGWLVGDDTHGSCFDCTFLDLTFEQSYIGWATNPAVVSVSGIFDCDVDRIRIFGWYQQAINVIGGNAVGAGNTACEFGSIFVHNNFAGPRANTASWPVLFELFSELVINSMSIQDAEVDASDCLALVNNGSVTINALHFEALDLGGDDYGFVYTSHNTTVNINSMTVQFCSSNPTTYNSVFRFFGNAGETPSVICNGLTLVNNTIDKLLYLADFGNPAAGGGASAAGATCIINCIANDTSTTGQFVGFVTGSSLTIVPVVWNYVGTAGQPAFAADWGNFGGGNAQLAFGMTEPGIVWINGVIQPSAGAGTTVFTFPAAFQPASGQIISGTDVTTSAACTWFIGSAGQVVFRGTLTATDEYVINGHYSLSI